MGLKFFCDRCDVELERERICRVESIGHMPGATVWALDLCADCNDALLLWLRTREPK